MHTIAETLRWKTWEQQFEEYLKTRVVTDDALEEKEEGSSPPHEPVNETNNSQSISEPKNVQTLFVVCEAQVRQLWECVPTSLRFNNHQKHCNSSSSDNSRLKRLRTNWAERERCDKCERVDYRQEDLATHQADMTTHQCRGTLHHFPWFQCPYCSQPRRFTTDQSLSSHINAQHAKEAMNDVKTWQSEDVSEVENTVNQHVEKSSDGLYKCGLCGKTAKRIRNLKNHIETHIEGLSFPCQLCGKTFRSRNSYNTHKCFRKYGTTGCTEHHK